MPTECSPALFDFAAVETRRVVAAFDGWAIASNAGALLLGATDRAIGLVRRFAACFRDARAPERIEHEVATLVGQETHEAREEARRLGEEARQLAELLAEEARQLAELRRSGAERRRTAGDAARHAIKAASWRG